MVKSKKRWVKGVQETSHAMALPDKLFTRSPKGNAHETILFFKFRCKLL
jgi:hypothetical protein